jgi:hypothetical protein
MSLSFIIINYNTYELTCKCIESLYQYNDGFEYEVILVDNASKECNPDLFKEKFPNIILIKSDTNLGFAGGNNIGIQHAKYDTFLLLNSDAYLIDNSTTIGLKKIQEDKNIGVLTGKLIFEDGRYQYNCQSFPSWQKLLVEKLRLQKLMPKNWRSSYIQGFYFDSEKEGYPDWIWGAYFMFRRDVLEKLPNQKLDDELFMYGEDRLWCYQIRQLGYEIYYTPQIVVKHKQGGSSANAKKFIVEHEEDFLNKYYSKTAKKLIKLLS